MQAQIFSDIHFEHHRGNYKSIWDKVVPSAPLALVAGDIDSADLSRALTELASKFERVICVMGNHDFYRRDIGWRPSPKSYPSNVTILDRSTVEYQGILFMGCTLWTDFNNADWFVKHRADDGISDFHQITTGNGGSRFTSEKAYQLHLKERTWLKKTIELNRGKLIVVMTHFMPSSACIAERWLTPGNDLLNYYFAAQCDDLIESSKALAWVFGHTHDRRELTIHGVPMWCNPIGYPREGVPYAEMILELPST